MKKILLQFVIWIFAAQIALAHVGSPNVFFEGRAGEYSVYAVVRPPAALPGAAQVSVRLQQEVGSVSLLPVMWQAGKQSSPAPIVTQKVSGETNLWSGEVWLLHPGSYSIQISASGNKGLGEATVPVNAIAMEGRQMKPAMRTMLILFAVFLFVGAVLIIGAVAREGCIGPGASGSRRRRSTVIAVLLLAAGVAASAHRWRNMDFAYRNQWGQKPEPVIAAVRVESDRMILELRQDEKSVMRPPWSALIPDHGKLMHMFLVREPELNVFAHLHPFRSDANTFALDLPALPEGEYQLYGDITFESGIGQTLVARVQLPKPAGNVIQPPPLLTNLLGEVICGMPPAITNAGQLARDMDDSWHLDSGAKEISSGSSRVSRLMGGYTLRFENASAVMAGRESSLHFSVFAPDGNEAPLQTYMGMLGHAAVRRADGSVFAHLHPLGSFSMASQEVFRGAGEKSVLTARLPAGNRVSFPYEFPKAGNYRLWIQIRVAGRVLTGVFDMDIKPSA